MEQQHPVTSDRDQEVDRLRSLYQTALMDSQPEERFDRITRLVAASLDVPVVLVSLVDRQRQFFKSAVGLAEPWSDRRETPLTHSFCQYVVRNGEPLIVEEARAHPLVCDNMAIPDLGVEAYLGVPLRVEGDIVIGSLCAIDGKPRVWTEADLAMLKDFGGLIEEQINFKARIRDLIETDAQRDLVQNELAHRIKNVFAVVGGLISICAKTKTDLNAYVQDVRARIGALAQANDYILAGKRQGGRAQASLEDVIRALTLPFAAADHEIRLEVCAAEIGETSAFALALIIHELATNAAKYGALSVAGGELLVRCAVVDGEMIIDWQERNGPQIDTLPTNKGFGSKMLARTVQGQLGGTIDYDFAPSGLSVKITMPANRLSL